VAQAPAALPQAIRELKEASGRLPQAGEYRDIAAKALKAGAFKSAEAAAS